MRKQTKISFFFFLFSFSIFFIGFAKCESGFPITTVVYNFISLAENQDYIGISNSSASFYYASDKFTLNFPKPTYHNGYYIANAKLSNFTMYNYVFTEYASVQTRIDKVGTTTPQETTLSSNKVGTWINNDSEYVTLTHFQQSDIYYFITLDILCWSAIENKDVIVSLTFNLNWELTYSAAVVSSLINLVLPILTPLIIAIAIPLVLAMQYKKLGFGIGCLIAGVIFMLTNSLATIVCIIELILGIIILVDYKKGDSE
jgi:hypothetical protein